MICISSPGIDGPVPVGQLPRDGCCPPSLCNIDLCALICNFIQHLPSGPMWDRPKAETLSWYQATPGQEPCVPQSWDGRCPTMVDHAVYWGLLLGDGITGPLQSLLREASPYSAYDTLDSWLGRLGWRDCYDCACRDPSFSGLSPIEIWGPIGEDGLCEGPICAAPTFSAELQCAVKRGTVIALARLALGPRRTVDAVNFVIAPLGARIEHICYRDVELDPRSCNEDDGTTLCDQPGDTVGACESTDGDPYRCSVVDDCPGHETMGGRCAPVMRQFEFKICPTGDYLPKCIKQDCADPATLMHATGGMNTTDGVPFVCDLTQAYYETTEDDAPGLPARIYPGVMAAECVVRSIFPHGSKFILSRCD